VPDATFFFWTPNPRDMKNEKNGFFFIKLKITLKTRQISKQIFAAFFVAIKKIVKIPKNETD